MFAIDMKIILEISIFTKNLSSNNELMLKSNFLVLKKILFEKYTTGMNCDKTP